MGSETVTDTPGSVRPELVEGRTGHNAAQSERGWLVLWVSGSLQNTENTT